MASARLSSPIRREYGESSSPDPLADSTNEDVSVVAPQQRRRSAGNTATPSKMRQRRTSDIELSPSKMIAEQSLSPWRIKVTVEAEPEDGFETALGNRKTQTVTRTMKVPLRDISSDSHRATKGQTSGARTKDARRSSSPARTRSRSRRQSVTNLDVVVLGDDGEENEWSSKPKSPKKRRNSKKSTPASKAGSVGFDIKEDEGLQQNDQDNAERVAEVDSPEMREIDLNQANTRSRANSTKDKETTDHTQKFPKVRTVSANSNVSYPTPSPTASEYTHSDDRDGGDVQNEPHVGMDTVMESEGFTMIDLDSLPSIKQMKNTPEYPSIPEEEADSNQHTSYEPTNIDQSSAEAPSIAVSNEETGLSGSDFNSSPPNAAVSSKSKKYSIGHLQLPSSTNVQRHRLITPMPISMNPYSSPKLPSPPRAPALTCKERSPIHSDQVVQAGSALQDAVTPATQGAKVSRSESQEEEAVFGGFSSETRRELRAELRFGEELGKKLAQKTASNGALDRQYPPDPRTIASNNVQIWRGETTVQHTPSPAVDVRKPSSQDPSVTKNPHLRAEEVLAANETRLERQRQQERAEVVEQVRNHEAITIDDDSEEENDRIGEDVDETMGDIWLAEARKTSSPRESVDEAEVLKDVGSDRPRRKLIPSPWKRGQQIEASHLSGDESFSGLFWKQQSSDMSSARFGEAIIANPEKIVKAVSNVDRRRSGVYDAEHMTIKAPETLYDHAYSDNDDQDFEDENFNDARGNMQWRSATDVIEEETKTLEATHNEQDSVEGDEENQGFGATGLYETNLEGVPEQDLSSSPHVQFLDNDRKQQCDHDSTYSSISEEDTEGLYRQRTSLSPSKQRPHTPRSALKGGRASFGSALIFNDDNDEANPRKVMWAKRSSCMNESWEESTRSVKSSQITIEDETPIPVERANEQLPNPEPTFEVHPQPVSEETQGKGWFGWFKKGTVSKQIPETQNLEQTRSQPQQPHSLDGSMDDFVEQDYDDDESSLSYAPTSRHVSEDLQPKATRSQSQRSEILNHKEDAPTTNTSTEIPSFLLPPSYPSDPTRDPLVTLSTSGPFTNTHFRTLNIIHRKSVRSRFHAPSYPDEIRPSIMELVGKWELQVDETAAMGENALFDFSIGATQARVLERFMREIEHGYHQKGIEDVTWGWTAEDLAEKLGRIAIGESVRLDEKEAKKSLSSKSRLG